MSDDYQRIELISGAVRRRQWTTEQKLQIIEESFQPGETVSSVARRRGVAPNLLYRWRRLMTEGGAAAVGSDEPVVGSSEVRRLEERVRELERMLGRKTMEVEIFREALAKSESKKPSLRLLSQPKDASVTVRNLVFEAGCASRLNEPLVEHDGELGLCLEPLARRHFPLSCGLAQDENQELRRGVIGWKMTSRAHGAA